MEEDARVLGRYPPGLYTISKDGALFSWSYQHGVEPFDRKAKRLKVEPPAASDQPEQPNGRALDDTELGDSDHDDEAEESDPRGSTFSGQITSLPESAKEAIALA